MVSQCAFKTGLKMGAFYILGKRSRSLYEDEQILKHYVLERVNDIPVLLCE